MIDTETLRKKIIDLAIQGKLTQQLSEDGNAEDLYAQIQEEKAKLIKEGKLKKEKPLPVISDDEIPFEIPENWKWVHLLDCGFTQTGNTPSKTHPEYFGDNMPFIGPGDIANGKMQFGRQGLTKEGKRFGRVCSSGSIMQVCIGGSIGKCAITDREAAFNQQINSITPIFCASKYLYYVLYSSYFFGIINHFASGMATPIINKSSWDSLLVPLPPIREQKRIVEKIDSIFVQIDIIDDLQKKYESDLEILKGKIIEAGISGKLTEQMPEDGDVEELYTQIKEEKEEILKNRGGRKDRSINSDKAKKPFDMPSNWRWIRFGEVGLFKKGPFGSALTKSMFVPKSDDAIKIYEQQHAIKKDSNLGAYYISREYFETNMKGFEVKPGDIIVSCAGTIGETYIMPSQIEQGIINQALMRVTLVPSILTEFFLYYFDSKLKIDARNESNGMAIKNIPPFDVMKNWYFPLPPLEEQKRITNKLNEIICVISQQL